MPLDPAIKYQP